MRFGSVCSGIEAASVAWCSLGWECAWVAEIEPFPCAVLAHHYPDVPNLGDITASDFCERVLSNGTVDVVVGGTPCQSFSVAGLRGGLADPRGNLALVFLAIIDRLRPTWLVWENVPGVLSSNGGRDFGSFLGALAKLGYGFAYRVLDAQYAGLAQRRKRVFVVGHSGDWRRATAVLFERHSLSGDSPPSREAGKDVAGTLAAGAQPSGFNGRDAERGNIVTHSLRADGFDASEDGTGRGTPLVACTLPASNGGASSGMQPVVPVHCFDARQNAVISYGDKTGPLDQNGQTHALVVPIDMRQASRGATMTNNRGDDVSSGGAPGTGIGEPGDPSPSISTSHPPAVAFDCKAGGDTSFAIGEKAGTLRGEGHGGGHAAVYQGMQVRRLTPMECERLQGFPDGYTDVPFRGKPAADGNRYKALGNSMATPVVRWIGERIELVEKTLPIKRSLL